MDKPTPGAKMGVGQREKSCFFSTDLDYTWHMYFSSPGHKYWHGLIKKTQTGAKMRKRVARLMQNGAFSITCAFVSVELNQLLEIRIFHQYIGVVSYR